MQGQRRIKFKRRSTIESNIEEFKRKGKDTKGLEAAMLRVLADITDLETQIEEFNVAKDAEALKVLASKQLAWVSSILGKENINASEINEAHFIVDLWSSIREKLYDETEEVPADMMAAFEYITSLAGSEDIFGNLNRVMGAYLADKAKYSSATELFEEFYGIKDSSMFREWGLDLSQTGLKLIMSTDIFMRNSLERADQEIKAKTAELNAKFKSLKDKGKDYKLLFQLNPEGEPTGNLVNPLSQAWFINFRDAKRKLKANIKALEHPTVNETVRAKGRKAAYRDFHNWMKTNAESIDIRFFIEDNFTDGTFTKDSYTKYLEGLFGEVRTAEIIEQAKEQHDKYLRDLEHIKEDLRGQFDTGEITKDEYDAKLDEWVLRNSPAVWFKQNEPMSQEFHQTYNNYVVTKPKKFINGKASGWYDTNYEKIENDADLFELYNYVRDYMNEMMSYLPKYLTKDQDVHAGFLPRIKRELLASITMKDFVGNLATMKEDWIQSITSRDGMDNRHLEIDPVTGKPYKNIPSAFIANMPVDERSFELDKVLAAFGKMALEYKWKSRAEDSAILASKFLDSVSTSEKRKQRTSDDLKALRSQLEYAMDVLLYNQSKMEQGKSNVKIFQGKTYLATEEAKEKVDARAKELLKDNAPDVVLDMLKDEFKSDVEIVSQRKKHKYLEDKVREIEEKYYTNQITQEERDALVVPLEEEALTLGSSVVWSKVGDKAIRYNQALALGFNAFSAVNNYMFGLTSNIIWAAGKTDFTPRDMWQAFGLMWKSVLNLKDKRQDKIANLIIKFNILSESVEFKSNSANETLEKIKNAPFALLKGGDYFIKGNTFIAKMLNTKIKDSAGNERSLYEAFDNEGNWKSDEFGDDKGWNGDFTEETEMQDFMKFRNSATQLIKKLHGNFDPKSAVKYKKYILGRMLGQFRFSWMMEGVEQRFGKRRYDQMLDRDVEGRYRSYYNLGWKKSLKILAKLALGQSTAFKGVRAQDRAIVEENMRRNLMEIFLYAMLTTLYLTLKSFDDDDDEDKKRYLVMNMLQRVMADTTFYLTPSTFKQIIQEPIPMMKLYDRSVKAFSSAEQLIFNDDLTENQTEQKWANITNAFPYINQYNRFKYMSEKVREY